VCTLYNVYNVHIVQCVCVCTLYNGCVCVYIVQWVCVCVHCTMCVCVYIVCVCVCTLYNVCVCTLYIVRVCVYIVYCVCVCTLYIVCLCVCSLFNWNNKSTICSLLNISFMLQKMRIHFIMLCNNFIDYRTRVYT